MMKHPLERQFLQIARSLWRPGIPLAVAVSGGIDSLALFTLLVAIQEEHDVDLRPVHVNHQLRPESQEDAHWLKDFLMHRFGCGLTVLAVDATPQPGESMEMAARRARYTALLKHLGELGEDARLATAHQRDDQAETVLMRALVGTGIGGLGGIHPTRGPIVRPLLNVPRQQLQAYLQDNNIPWREDPTNSDPGMLRNRIRHHLMPIIRTEVNPRASEALARLAEDARRQQEGLDAALDRWLSGQVWEDSEHLLVDVEWRSWPTAWTLRILERFAERQGLRLSHQHLEAALAGSTSWPRGWQVEHRNDGRLQVSSGQPTTTDAWGRPMQLSADTVANFSGFRIHTRKVPAEKAPPGWTAISGAWPDLWVRAWRRGDRMQPLGMGGHSKKLHDMFVDAKVPRDLRPRWPVLVGHPDNGPILAVPGIRVAEAARFRPGDTIWLVRVDAPSGFQVKRSR
ncbi:tRNA lysidine(34) synthetase TilS [Sulfobacillus harzensis]|uniref:tRNA(Ile)-lysidine synthase n=1 Tax=Sulfobacillus harzensis TaxID=2729629 RepID=A0A7Y0Q0X0_9FIRM|nr:tRNA lysidine(34) synthetase TilS [Sulfobacillus harzensis]NMP21483.1 tRNA lysidine(34) synthetase TilS [Sulfobacillus harzensis]